MKKHQAQRHLLSAVLNFVSISVDAVFLTFEAVASPYPLSTVYNPQRFQHFSQACE
jgi:hypothetical protein